MAGAIHGRNARRGRAEAVRARLREWCPAPAPRQPVTRLGVVDRRFLDSVAQARWVGRLPGRPAVRRPTLGRIRIEHNPRGAPLEGQWPAGRPLDFVGEQAVDQLDVRIVEARP